MIFWATVLSFIVGLMYFMMYPRSDKIDTIDKPASEALIANFVSQHQAARDYIREILLSTSKMTGAPHESNETEAQKKLFILPSSFEDFIPDIQLLETAYNLNPESHCSSDNNCGGYVSILACLTRKDKTNPDGTRITGELIDCIKEPAKVKYVMTYGYVPETDINLFKNKNLLWEEAVLRRTSGSPDCGFLYQTNPSIGVAGEFKINTSQNLTRKIPQAISDALHNTIQGAAQDPVDQSKKWLLFCISPVHDPYVTEGLILHYDSIINSLSPQLHHEKEASEWPNLTRDSDNFALIDGNSKKWNPYNDTALFFDGTKIVNTQLDQTNFGNYFTISYVVKYNSSSNSYGTFGSESDIPRLIGGLYNGKTLTFGIKGYGDTLSVPVQTNKIVQITYTVDQQSHAIYVNGVLKARANFPIFTHLSSANFLIGQSPLDSSHRMEGNLYNFKVYERVLRQEEILHNLKTDKKRFNFK